MTTTVLLEALRQASHRLRGAPVEGWSAASDAELRELLAIAAGLRQSIERHAALGAGEVSRRSRPQDGLAGFAQRAGHRTVEEFLRVETGVSARDAAAAKRVGDLATVGGVLGEAIRNARVSVAAADAIQSGLGAPSDAVPVELLDQAADRLCDDAASLDPDRLQRRAREVRDELDETGVADRETQRRAARSLRLVRQADGMTRISWLLDPESAAIVTEAYDRATSPRRGGPRFVDPARREQASAISDDPRTTEQLASDSFTELLRQAAAVDREVLVSAAPTVGVLVTASALEGRAGHGVLESGEAVSIATVERGSSARTARVPSFSPRPRRCSTWGVSSASTPGINAARWRCATAAACGPDAIGRPPGRKRITSSTGHAITAGQTWPTESCSADIIIFGCTTRGGRSVAERTATGSNRLRTAVSQVRCSKRNHVPSASRWRRGEPRDGSW